MKNSVNTNNPLVSLNKVKVPVEKSICKIDISGYSLDNYRTFNPEGYTMLCHLGETVDGLSYFPKSSKIVLDTGWSSNLINNFDQLIPTIAEDLGITQQAAVEKYVDFFSDKIVVVQPTGLQGKFYKLLNSVQNFVPMAYTSEAVSILKTTGMTGLKVIAQAPLTFVGATYIGALFFGYCGSVAGNNSVGVVFNSTSFLLSRPMRGVEITLNGLILRPISNVIGLPLILNGTQEMLNGKGLSIQEYTKIGIAFERISNSTIVKKVRKVYKIILGKDE